MDEIKWVQVAQYKRFNVWFNTKGKYRECFEKNINPNDPKTEGDEEDGIYKD